MSADSHGKKTIKKKQVTNPGQLLPWIEPLQIGPRRGTVSSLVVFWFAAGNQQCGHFLPRRVTQNESDVARLMLGFTDEIVSPVSDRIRRRKATHVDPVRF